MRFFFCVLLGDELQDRVAAVVLCEGLVVCELEVAAPRRGTDDAAADPGPRIRSRSANMSGDDLVQITADSAYDSHSYFRLLNHLSPFFLRNWRIL